MTQEIKELLTGIDFISRYKLLSEKHSHEESMERTSKEEVLKIFDELGVSVKYFAKDSFYQIKEVKEPYQFVLNISVKYGLTDFIFSIKKGDDFLETGGPNFTWIAYEMNDRKGEKIFLPSFKSYEELKNILTEALAIYRDIVKAVTEVLIHLPRQ